MKQFKLTVGSTYHEWMDHEGRLQIWLWNQVSIALMDEVPVHVYFRDKPITNDNEKKPSSGI